jgi:flagellin-like hook-associated protein FlgL
MSAIPSSLARVPNALSSQVLLSALTKTQQDLLHTQVQLSTAKRVNRGSDDAIAASTIAVLDDVIERRLQRQRNLDHASGLLNNIDAALGDATDLMLEAKSLGLSQIGIGSDADTRRTQAEVIDSILSQMIAIANRDHQGIHYFGGSATAGDPLVELLGSLQYVGNGESQVTDLGALREIPVTLPGDQAFGVLSTRVEGDHDLDPSMTVDTRLLDIAGARGQGVTLGSISVVVSGTPLTVDLSQVHTIGDTITALQTAIQAIDPLATVDIDPATGDRLRITAAAGSIVISDLAGDATAADLGLTGAYPVGTTAAQDVNPLITELTTLAQLTGVTVPPGTIRIVNGGQTRDLDLSSALTVQDVMNLVAGLDLGVRVEIAPDGDRLNFINELSGGAMSIGEVAGGTTATELGVRSFTGTTELEDFNDGLGVGMIDGSVDPITGLPDPAEDLDFRITLKDGTTFDVDLANETTVQDVLNTINAAAGGLFPATFSATLAPDGNGIHFVDNTIGPPGTFAVTALNNSTAASDLGILGTTTGATFTGEDRAKVAVDSVFSHLISLREALRGDDERGIELATQRLEDDLARVVEARAVVGVRGQRVADAQTHEEDQMIQDQSLRSQVQDLDIAEASIRFSQLQQQLQASLATAARTTSLSLLDFLG